jgi:hypothetical protein
MVSDLTSIVDLLLNATRNSTSRKIETQYLTDALRPSSMSERI